MAGDVKANLVSVAQNAELTIQPAQAGDAWVIHNIYFQQVSGAECSVEIHRKSTANGGGPLDCKIDTALVAGGLFGCAFHLTLDQYITVKNCNSTAVNILIGYDGVQVK